MEKRENKSIQMSAIKDFKQHNENPFIPNLLIKKGKKNIVIAKTDKALFNKSTGEMDDDTLFIGTKKDLDKDQFVKIFHSHLQAIFDLSKATLKVFGYIASVTEFGDKIIFDIEDCKKHTGYSSNNVIYKALTELLKADIIARTEKAYLYYINPQVFYKGDRIVLVTEYRKKRERTALPNPNQASIWKEDIE